MYIKSPTIAHKIATIKTPPETVIFFQVLLPIQAPFLITKFPLQDVHLKSTSHVLQFPVHKTQPLSSQTPPIPAHDSDAGLN